GRGGLMRQRGKLRPLTPIFDAEVRRGGIAVGNTPGEIPPVPLVLVYDTSLSSGTTISMYLDTPVDVRVVWRDDDTHSATFSVFRCHTYDSDGVYTVKITGTSLYGLGGATQ